MLEYRTILKVTSRELRSNMTAAERILWSRIRKKQLHGVQFYRQKPIGPYIVDFYAPAAKIVIEVDGSQHADPDHYVKDKERDRCLAEAGLLVMRFDNAEVLHETESVVERIFEVILNRL